jgi:exportin-1
MLQVYLTWIPVEFIFNTNLLDILLGLFPQPPFRNLALQCLTEIGSLPEVGEEHNDVFRLLFQHFMAALVQVLQPATDIAEVLLHWMFRFGRESRGCHQVQHRLCPTV